MPIEDAKPDEEEECAENETANGTVDNDNADNEAKVSDNMTKLARENSNDSLANEETIIARHEVSENAEKDHMKKKVTWGSKLSDNNTSIDEFEQLEPLVLKGDGDRPTNLDLNLNEKVDKVDLFTPEGNSDESSMASEFTIEKYVPTSWEIDCGKPPSSKQSKRLEALKQARSRSSRERYTPPKVMVSANQIAQRKVLDLKRW